MKQNITKNENHKKKRNEDMKADYIALYLKGYRKDVVLGMLAKKYYLTNDTIKKNLEPFSSLHKEATG